jgi:hypothetical protein
MRAPTPRLHFGFTTIALTLACMPLLWLYERWQRRCSR